MDIIWSELTFGIADRRQLVILVFRLLMAALMGAAIGYERERAGKAAGLRTHILVTSATAVFVLACAGAGFASDPLSRIIQGIATGIGFVGTATIIKEKSEDTIQGVTTAAGIYMAAGIGVAVGLGEIGLALISTALCLIILRVTLLFEARPEKSENA
jgi:putative Mg2+ transporter-C (MgtC) family protein